MMKDKSVTTRKVVRQETTVCTTELDVKHWCHGQTGWSSKPSRANGERALGLTGCYKISRKKQTRAGAPNDADEAPSVPDAHFFYLIRHAKSNFKEFHKVIRCRGMRCFSIRGCACELIGKHLFDTIFSVEVGGRQESDDVVQQRPLAAG